MRSPFFTRLGSQAKDHQGDLSILLVAQLSYILLCSSVGAGLWSVELACRYLLLHSCAKITLFFGSGILYRELGISDVVNARSGGKVAL